MKKIKRPADSMFNRLMTKNKVEVTNRPVVTSEFDVLLWASTLDTINNSRYVSEIMKATFLKMLQRTKHPYQLCEMFSQLQKKLQSIHLYATSAAWALEKLVVPCLTDNGSNVRLAVKIVRTFCYRYHTNQKVINRAIRSVKRNFAGSTEDLEDADNGIITFLRDLASQAIELVNIPDPVQRSPLVEKLVNDNLDNLQNLGTFGYNDDDYDEDDNTSVCSDEIFSDLDAEELKLLKTGRKSPSSEKFKRPQKQTSNEDLYLDTDTDDGDEEIHDSNKEAYNFIQTKISTKNAENTIEEPSQQSNQLYSIEENPYEEITQTDLDNDDDEKTQTDLDNDDDNDDVALDIYDDNDDVALDIYDDDDDDDDVAVNSAETVQLNKKTQTDLDEKTQTDLDEKTQTDLDEKTQTLDIYDDDNNDDEDDDNDDNYKDDYDSDTQTQTDSANPTKIIDVEESEIARSTTPIAIPEANNIEQFIRSEQHDTEINQPLSPIPSLPPSPTIDIKELNIPLDTSNTAPTDISISEPHTTKDVPVSEQDVIDLKEITILDENLKTLSNLREQIETITTKAPIISQPVDNWTFLQKFNGLNLDTTPPTTTAAAASQQEQPLTSMPWLPLKTKQRNLPSNYRYKPYQRNHIN